MTDSKESISGHGWRSENAKNYDSAANEVLNRLGYSPQFIAQRQNGLAFSITSYELYPNVFVTYRLNLLHSGLLVGLSLVLVKAGCGNVQERATCDEAAAFRWALGEPAGRRETGDQPARDAGGGRAGGGRLFAESGRGRLVHPPAEREDPGAADDSGGVGDTSARGNWIACGPARWGRMWETGWPARRGVL